MKTGSEIRLKFHNTCQNPGQTDINQQILVQSTVLVFEDQLTQQNADGKLCNCERE